MDVALSLRGQRLSDSNECRPSAARTPPISTGPLATMRPTGPCTERLGSSIREHRPLTPALAALALATASDGGSCGGTGDLTPRLASFQENERSCGDRGEEHDARAAGGDFDRSHVLSEGPFLDDARELLPAGPLTPGRAGHVLVDADASDRRHRAGRVRSGEPLDRGEGVLLADPTLGQ